MFIWLCLFLQKQYCSGLHLEVHFGLCNECVFFNIYKYMYITCILYVPGFMLCLQPGPLSSTAKSKRHEIKSDPTPFGYEGTS